MGKKLMLIINPISGKLKGLSNREALCGHLGQTYEVDIYLTQKRGDGTALTLAHLQDYDVVGGCGGDGEFREGHGVLLGRNVKHGRRPQDTGPPQLCEEV